jgi:superfamily II DNA or RNA helicase
VTEDEGEVFALELRDNRMYIHCPSLRALEEMKRFLTFTRWTFQRYPGRRKNMPVVEPCYTPLDVDPFLLSCPAGFYSAVVKKFNKNYGFSVTKQRTPRITENTVPDWSLLPEDVVFRHGQRELLEKICLSDRGSILVPTGVGKSFMICQHCRILPKARILVSTYSSPVLRDHYKALCKALPGKVGLVTGSEKPVRPDARIVCISQGTLGKFLPLHGDQNVDVLHIDEQHEWGSAKRLQLLENVRAARIFGWSANKTRSDKAEFRLQGIFGEILGEMEYDEAVDHDLITPICVVWVPVASFRDPAENYENPVARERYGMWVFNLRNRIIARTARLMDPDDQVLISARTLEQALHLRKYLPEFTPVYRKQDPGSRNMQKFFARGLLKGIPPMTDDRLEKLKQAFTSGRLKKAIATDVWSRGVNFPDLAVVIRADGKNSCIADTQWPGRAVRKREDKEVSLIFDFTDEYNPAFSARADGRRKRYEKNRWQQIGLDTLLDMMGLPGLPDLKEGSPPV